MDKQRTELIKHPEQPAPYEFGVEQWHDDGCEQFELTDEEKFEIREMAAALVNYCIARKVPIQVFAIGGQDQRGELMMNVGNLWPPCRVPITLLAATSVFKRGTIDGLQDIMSLLDYVKERGPRKPTSQR